MNRYRILIPLALLLALTATAIFPAGTVYADDPVPTETPAATPPPEGEEPPVDETNLIDVVETLDQTDSVVLNDKGLAEPLVSPEVADALTTGDPYIVRGGTTYRFLHPGGCAAYGGVGPTCTESATPVQAAIDFAVAGETIFIEAGVYTEQIFITKDITLQGSPGAIIQSPVTVGLCYNTPAANEPIVCVKDTNNVSIIGLEIDGAGQGNGDYRFEGIGFFNAGGLIQGNEIHAVRDTPLSGTQHGVGIYAFNLDGTPRTLVVDDNDIYDFQKNGMALLGTGLTVEVTDNTVTGSGPLGLGMPAQNGIQIGNGATGVISGNTISGIWYTDPSWASIGILLSGTTGTVEVSDNTITDTKDAIYFYGSTASDANITGNVILNCEWGITVFSTTGTLASADIIGNTIDGCTVVAVYSDNPTTVVNENNFVNSGPVVFDDWASQGGPMDATNNYWGCPDGANTEGCSTTEGDVLTEPYASAPFVPPAPDAGSEPPAPPANELLFIRAVSGTPYDLSCTYPLTILQLPNGDRVLYYDLCSYAGKLTSKTAAELPGALPEGVAFASAMDVAVSRSGAALDLLPNGQTMTVSFVIPDELAGKQFAILYWDPKANNSTGGWVELANKPGSIYPDDPDETRRLTIGVHSGDGRVKATVNFSGLFVLITK